MPRCIFCKSTAAPFSTREHILPESLGGGDWAILPDGLFCDGCQNHFGSSIEQQALEDYPFSFFRVFLGIPTKKLKAPWFSSWEGVLRASPYAGHVGYDPSPQFERAVADGRKTQMRLIAHPGKPDMVCRALLKMGIEVVAADDQSAVFDGKFDAAREYALRGTKSGDWWYLQHEDMQLVNRYTSHPVSPYEWGENVQLSVVEIEDSAEVFHLKLMWMDLFTPLEARVRPPTDMPEPEYRVFLV